jgi:CBS domain containing-hemolysin-like protein|tara:strand:- start:2117 stop:3415 length:1299 start_codon:yes stop_codon:yes gene_type:complete
MDPDPSSSLIFIALSLLASAFFSGMEIAYVSANRLQLELDAKSTWQGKILAHLASRPQLFIATMLVGNNLALVFCGLESGALISSWIFQVDDWTVASSPFAVLATQTALTTAVILVLAEFIPKALFHANSNFWLKFFAAPLVVIHYLLMLPGAIVVALSKIFIRIVGESAQANDASNEQLGATDLDYFIRELSGRMEPEQELEHELQIMQNALEFNKVLARDCLVPRNEVVAVDMETPLEEVKELFISTGLSKIVIYRNDIDQTIGYIHSKDLFRDPDSIKSILHPTFVVPEPMPADDVLKRFIQRKRHLAIVVDEFGGTSGILTMEDIMEQLIGDIEDEHDNEELIEEELEQGRWRFSARLEVEELNEKYNLDMPEQDDYETVGGLLLHHAEDIPDAGFSLKFEHCTITVEQVGSSKIQTVIVTQIPSTES